MTMNKNIIYRIKYLEGKAFLQGYFIDLIQKSTKNNYPARAGVKETNNPPPKT